MRTTKKCPKCYSTNLIRYSGNNAANSKHFENTIALGSPVWELIKVHQIICCDCGYIENWISQKDLDKIQLCKNSKG